MKRDSKQAQRIVADLGNPTVTGRRLERWSAAKLLPPAGTDEATVESYVTALVDAAPQGRDADTVALIMAARGFGVERLPDTMARVFGAPSAAKLREIEEHEAQQRIETPVVTIDPLTDDGSRQVEEAAYGFLALPDTVGDRRSDPLQGVFDLLSVVMGVVVTNAQRDPVPEDPIAWMADTTDDRDPPRMESPERVTISAAEGLFSLLLGAEPSSYTALNRLADPEGRIEDLDPEQAEQYAEAGRLAGALAQRVSWIPPEGFVMGAQAAKLLLRWTGIDRYLGDPDRADMIAGALSIAGIVFAPVLFSVAADAGIPLEPPPAGE